MIFGLFFQFFFQLCILSLLFISKRGDLFLRLAINFSGDGPGDLLDFRLKIMNKLFKAFLFFIDAGIIGLDEFLFNLFHSSHDFFKHRPELIDLGVSQPQNSIVQMILDRCWDLFFSLISCVCGFSA